MTDRVTMAEYLVDVVAAAAELDRKTIEDGGGECAFGHVSPAGTRFCGECGLPVGGEIALTPRVDLEAVREAVQQPVTPEVAERREREHAMAMTANMQAEQNVRDVTQVEDPSEKKFLIHFVEDGFTWGGKVWQRGEMLEMGPKHPRWGDALGWIRMTKQEQYARYGRVYFDHGPYPGAVPEEGKFIPTADQSRWGQARGLPARSAGDGSNALVPF